MIVTYIHSTCAEDQIRVQLRCRNFADAINRTRVHSAHLLELDAFIRNTPEAEQLCSASDLLVIHRYVFGPVLPVIQYWKARDKKVIVDFDQALNHLTPDLPGYTFWMEGNTQVGFAAYRNHSNELPLEQFKWGLGMLDAATVSSSRLADDWSRLTTIYEIPEYLNTYQYPASEHGRGTEIWVGLGNTSPFSSLEQSGLLAAMQQVCQKRPQVRLIWSDAYNDLPRQLDLPAEQVQAYARHSFEDWVNALLKLDLGVFPMAGNYDLRLSSIHLLEFMLSKIPWVASGYPGFREYSKYGVWVKNSAEAWENALLHMVDHLGAYRKKASGEAFLFALGQDISVNVDKVLRVYTSILTQAQR